MTSRTVSPDRRQPAARSSNYHEHSRLHPRGVHLVVFAALVMLLLPSTAASAGEAKLAWDANAETNVAGYKVYLGESSGSYQASTNVGTDTSCTVTGLVEGRVYYFAVTAYDANGKESGFSAEVSTMVDGTPPTVAMSAPTGGATVSGTITVEASAIDNVGVAGVQFTLDGGNLGAEDTTAPYAVAWDTTTTSAGAHTLTAVARDAAGNATTAVSISVTVANGVLRLAPQDTSLSVNATNYSSHTTLMTYTWPDYRVANAILMKFDVSSIPPGATVQEATLYLALVGSDGAADSTYTMTAHRVVGKNPVMATATGYTVDGVTSWTANGCCYNNVPLAQSDISVAYDTRAIDKTPGYKSWTITAMVQEWLAAPTTNFGLLLNSDASKLADRYRYFASMEHPDATLRPYLNVKYSLVSLDTTAPSVAITAPAGGATVAGTVTLAGNASDNVDVAGVQFKVNGLNLGAEDTAAPYNASWDSKSVSNGGYTLTAVARDAAGNATVSTGVSVTVANDTTPPVISGVKVSSITTTAATITWSTNEASDSQVKYGPTTMYGSATLVERSLVTSHVVTLSGLSNASLYHFRVRSRDAAGNLRTSVDYTFTTLDGTAPMVSVAAPAAGATVSGTITVEASATDNVGVAGVQFKLDGVDLGAEDTTAPYAVAWDTTSVSGGAHTLTAVARDAAGNVTTALATSVTVANGIVWLAPQDTSLSVNATNYSSHTTLMTYTWPDYRVANAILMKFDLSAIPPGATVQEATLYLALVGSDGAADSTYTVTAHTVVGRNPVMATATGYTVDGVTSWTANGCCYNNVPLAQSDISLAYDTRAIDKTPGYKSWTITAMVQEWLAAPTTNFGLLLNSDVSTLADRYRYFASMEHPDATLRPVLRVAYWAPTLDGTAPTVSVAAPAAGATVSGTITVEAGATDNVGVAGVQFKLNGVDLGAEDTTAPYAVAWDTTSVSDGAHTLTAVARDAADNVTTALATSVTVANGIVWLAPQDTSLSVNATNYSSHTTLMTYTWPDYRVANAILMKFDLSSIPPGAAVQEATLYLALVGSDGAADSTYTVTAHTVVGKNPVMATATGYTVDGVTSWTASGCCYNNVPLAQSDISLAYDTRAIDKTPGYKSWTITAMVQEWLAAPTTNFGLLLNSDASTLADRYRYFASMEHPDATLRPVLRIKLTTP